MSCSYSRCDSRHTLSVLKLKMLFIRMGRIKDHTIDMNTSSLPLCHTHAQTLFVLN